jgi:hypothetical protein
MKKASRIVEALFRDKRIDDADTYFSLFGSWRDIAGPDLADHCDLVDIRNNTAVIAVDHPGWMQLFQMEKNRILKTLKKKYPSLSLVSVHVYLVSAEEMSAYKERKISGAVQPPNAQKTKVTDEVTEEAAKKQTAAATDSDSPGDSLSGIQDPELKQILKRLGNAIDKRSGTG